ncbi:hypothetical protein ACES2L_00870 [Bdellovibrio bacteriovorus]
MAQENNKIPLSKKGRRDVSPFIGHELLYDYLTGSLDKERRSAVEDHVKFSRDAQLDLSKIQSGQQYAEKLADTVVSQPIITQINTPSSYLSVLMQKSNFEKWPQGLKWGLEALVVVAGIVTVLSITPWQKVMEIGSNTGSKEIILAEVEKTGTTPVVEDKPEFVDEGVSPKDTPVAAVKEVTATPAPAKTASPTPSPSPTAKVAETKTEAAPTAAATGGGFLFRGNIAITNIDDAAPKINEKIKELGGRKAGSVELGWKKTPNSLYYHFTIPEAKYQDLMTFLGTYGSPKIGKEKHPRVMPDGIVRMIITVDEK